LGITCGNIFPTFFAYLTDPDLTENEREVKPAKEALFMQLKGKEVLHNQEAESVAKPEQE
jgi:hypothetical protein